MQILSKTLVAFAILSFFSLGIVSVSFATRVPLPSSPLHYGRFHGSFKDKMAPMDKRTLNAGMLFEENGELPKPAHSQSTAGSVEHAFLEVTRVTSISRTVLASKVSTCIFQSVLNL